MSDNEGQTVARGDSHAPVCGLYRKMWRRASRSRASMDA